YKRASNYEKLYAVTRGKLEAVTDRQEEMQRRYYAVCRELAVAAGRRLDAGQTGDEEAAKVAHEVVSAAEAAVQRRQRKPRPRQRPRKSASASPEAADAETGSDAATTAATDGESPAATPEQPVAATDEAGAAEPAPETTQQGAQ
ncbi:MAG: hypothetical protein JXR83_16660, partial [Deltaproteobacteria bacterium]|nr:hypothetical protein [Deltaproteobacteria bacterium]